MGLFEATRPLTDIEIAFGKLRLAFRSHLQGLAIVCTAVAVIVLTSHNDTVLIALWSQLAAQQGTLGSYLSLLLLLVLATAASWTGAVYFMSVQLFSQCVDAKKHGWKISVAVIALFLLTMDLAGRL